MSNADTSRFAEEDESSAGDRSLAEDLHALAGDGRTFLQAELAYQKARVFFAVGRIRTIAILAVLAGALALFSLMALVFGLLLALTPLLTAWGATAVVVGSLAISAFLALKLAATRWTKMLAILSDEDGPS
ncbi:MAG TPA: phage holin family protein [Novosphingobium sp.]